MPPTTPPPAVHAAASDALYTLICPTPAAVHAAAREAFYWRANMPRLAYVLNLAFPVALLWLMLSGAVEEGIREESRVLCAAKGLHCLRPVRGLLFLLCEPLVISPSCADSQGGAGGV